MGKHRRWIGSVGAEATAILLLLRSNFSKHGFFVSFFPYLMAVMGKSNQLAVFILIQVLG
jgi:hypothetical protein